MDAVEPTAELRRVAEHLAQDTVSHSQFARYGRVSPGFIERRFGTWNNALEAAGLRRNDRFKRLADEDLEVEFRRVYMKLGKAPTRNEFSIESSYGPTVYDRRYGTWSNTVAHYLGEKAQPVPATAAGSERSRSLTDQPHTPKARVSKRMFGAPLNFRELRHEPINEQGVVYLFGMVARELGFLVEGVATEFPDFDAKRMTKGGLYERVRIEFEFRSRNFREHGHNENDCDLVVCWIDDWSQCPVEVLELRAAIQQLPPSA